MTKTDYKKEYKDLYGPGTSPSEVTVPPMTFITVEGEGPPEEKRFAENIELLYSLSYTIKMKGKNLKGWFDHVVPPLEGSWWFNGPELPEKRDEWKWKLMIRQPEYVDRDAFGWALEIIAKKKPKLVVYNAILETIDEGLCVQALHIGPYSTEGETIDRILEFIGASDLHRDISDTRKHHEIYLSDPEKTDPEKMRTVIRLPVSRI